MSKSQEEKMPATFEQTFRDADGQLKTSVLKEKETPKAEEKKEKEK